jgi:hypothetical protein
MFPFFNEIDGEVDSTATIAPGHWLKPPFRGTLDVIVTSRAWRNGLSPEVP